MNNKISPEERSSLRDLIDPGCGSTALVAPDHLPGDAQVSSEFPLTDSGGLPCKPDLCAELTSPCHTQLSLGTEFKFSVDRTYDVNYSLLSSSRLQMKVSRNKRKKST